MPKTVEFVTDKSKYKAAMWSFDGLNFIGRCLGRVGLVCLFWQLCISTAKADLAVALRDCSRIKDSVERLDCFDRLARVNAPQPSTPLPIGDTGAWDISREVSKIDDSETVYVSVYSNQEASSRFGGKQKLRITFRCLENKTEAMIYFGGHFMSDNEGGGRVTLRIDQKPARTEYFSASTNHEALFAPAAIALAKSLFGADVLVVRATPFNESPLVGEFNVAGLETAIQPLRQACGWAISPTKLSTPTTSIGSVVTSPGHFLVLGREETYSKAIDSYARAQAKYPDLLEKYQAKVDSVGTGYRVRIGPFGDTIAAAKLCEALKLKGGNCLMTSF